MKYIHLTLHFIWKALATVLSAIADYLTMAYMAGGGKGAWNRAIFANKMCVASCKKAILHAEKFYG